MKQLHAMDPRIAQCALQSEAQLAEALALCPEGWNNDQAQAQREKYGENTILGHTGDSFGTRIRRAFINPFSVVLFLLAAISFLTDGLMNANFSRNSTTVILMLLMLLLSGTVRLMQELRAKQITDALVQLVHTTVQVRREGRWQERPAEELVVGDRIRLEAGDPIPADIRLVQTRDFFISQSVITGESGILEKHAQPLPQPPTGIGDYSNTIFLGSTVTGGTAEGIVLAVGQATVYGGITPTEDWRKRGYDRGENAIAWVLIQFMALLVPVVFLASGITKGNWLEAFLFALSVAVGLTPELLPMVITACLARGSALMGQKQTIVRNVNAMQGFGSMDVLCVDKTGTLTEDTVLLEYYMDILGNESRRTLECAFLGSYYHTGVSNHLDAAILQVQEMPSQAHAFRALALQHQKLDEVPFDYNRKFASVLLQNPQGRILMVKGSVQEVVHRCTHVEYRGERFPIQGNPDASVEAIVEEMRQDGMKVLAVACRSLERESIAPEDEYGLTLLGYLAFFDAPKPSAAQAVTALQSLQIGVKVLTGDHADVAVSVCRRLGIPTQRVLTGPQVDALDENELPIQIERCSIFAELTPRQKAYIVELLQENGHVVGFLGDGMNDLPAEYQADVGISVDTAMDAVKESADVILLKKDLNVLSEGVREGRKAFANMSKYIKITASSNFGNICAIVVASVLLPFFPMTSVQLLLLNLLYDLMCLVLPWDHVDDEIFCKPREWSGKRLARFMLLFGPVSSIFDLLTFGFLYFYLCPTLCGGPFQSLSGSQQATFIALFQTGWFLESMWTQILILHMLRTRQIPILQSRPSRPVVLVTLMGIVCFTLLTVTPIGTLLGLTALPGIYFVFLVGAVLLYLLLGTAVKRFYIQRWQELI